MHALQRFLREGLERTGWTQADLARESGLSKQVVSKLLREDRPPVARLLKDKTVEGLARAFQVDSGVVRAAIAEEMGLPGAEVQVVYDARGVADDELIRELARRLRAASAGTSAEAGGSSISLVRPAAGAGLADSGSRLSPPSTPVIAWAARAGEPDRALDPRDDLADEASPGAQDGAEGQRLV